MCMEERAGRRLAHLGGPAAPIRLSRRSPQCWLPAHLSQGVQNVFQHRSGTPVGNRAKSLNYRLNSAARWGPGRRRSGPQENARYAMSYQPWEVLTDASLSALRLGVASIDPSGVTKVGIINNLTQSDSGVPLRC
jgi:hypothetical protein